MSFDAVFREFKMREKSIRETIPDTPYAFVNDALGRTNSLLLKWLSVYREFAKGYSQELLARTSYFVIRWLSSTGDIVERKLKAIFDAKMPFEVYILLKDFCTEIGYDNLDLVLAEGSSFEQSSMYSELSETLNSLSFPRPTTASSRIEVALKDIRNQDIVIIYYERGQSKNVLCWPLLLHEMFHSIYDKEKLHRLSKNCPAVPWLDEALIDLYLTKFFGPAYTISLATYLQRFPYEVSISHPSFSSRIFIALRYLTELQNEGKLPSPLSEQIPSVFLYLKDIWDKHKTVDAKDVQKSVEIIYSNTGADIRQIILEKTLPFVDFLLKTEEKRQKAFKSTAVDFTENEISSISDVAEYFSHGIPIAADPRILFNAFVSESYQEMATSPELNIFIKESLKKWHIKNAWLKAKESHS